MLFQSTRPRGARLEPHRAYHGGDRFNPRARAGRDPRYLIALLHGHSFNPRARAGRDRGNYDPADTNGQFQSTRPRGARPGTVGAGGTVDAFQSTRPRGARQHLPPDVTLCYGFNPRARAGRDWVAGVVKIAKDMFQSTRPRGARPPGMSRRRRNPKFQSTRPRGARPTNYTQLI